MKKRIEDITHNRALLSYNNDEGSAFYVIDCQKEVIEL